MTQRIDDDITTLGLKPATTRSLKSAGILTIAVLKTKSKQELLKIHNFHLAALMDVRMRLRERDEHIIRDH